MVKVESSLSGEFFCEVKKGDKVVRSYPVTKNLILNQGLNSRGVKGGYLSDSSRDSDSYFNWRYCGVGTGNSEPLVTQTSLDTPIAKVKAPFTDYIGDSVLAENGIFKSKVVSVFEFYGLEGNNITELGLYANGYYKYNPSIAAYSVLATRALIKDAEGNATSITLLEDEILVVTYTVTVHINTVVAPSVINVIDRDGNLEPYNVETIITNLSAKNISPIRGFTGDNNTSGVGYNDKIFDYTPLESAPVHTYLPYRKTPVVSPYVVDSFEQEIYMFFPISEANNDLKYISMGTSSHPTFIFKISKVSDGSPLTKTGNETLKIPMLMKWGRKE